MHQLFQRTGQISEEQRNPVFQDTKKKTSCCVANKGLQNPKTEIPLEKCDARFLAFVGGGGMRTHDSKILTCKPALIFFIFS
jgi:hypothetical protein